jgi:hypothetical protein
VPDLRWSAISWRSRWMLLMLSFRCASSTRSPQL